MPVQGSSHPLDGLSCRHDLFKVRRKCFSFVRVYFLICLVVPRQSHPSIHRLPARGHRIGTPFGLGVKENTNILAVLRRSAISLKL